MAVDSADMYSPDMARETVNAAAQLPRHEVRQRLAGLSVSGREERRAIKIAKRVTELRYIGAERLGEKRAAELLAAEVAQQPSHQPRRLRLPKAILHRQSSVSPFAPIDGSVDQPIII
jgi:hypothetical protein